MVPQIAPRLPRGVDEQVSANRAPISFLKQFEFRCKDVEQLQSQILRDQLQASSDLLPEETPDGMPDPDTGTTQMS